MRKIIAIFFLFVLVFTTEARQLVKLPFLVKHYSLHIAEGRSESLIDFLAEHYMADHGADADAQQDQNLPFNSADLNGFSATYLLTTPDYTTTLARTPDKQIIFSTDFSLPVHAHAIFHPPRIF